MVHPKIFFQNQNTTAVGRPERADRERRHNRALCDGGQYWELPNYYRRPRASDAKFGADDVRRTGARLR